MCVVPVTVVKFLKIFSRTLLRQYKILNYSDLLVYLVLADVVNKVKWLYVILVKSCVCKMTFCYVGL